MEVMAHGSNQIPTPSGDISSKQYFRGSSINTSIEPQTHQSNSWLSTLHIELKFLFQKEPKSNSKLPINKSGPAFISLDQQNHKGIHQVEFPILSRACCSTDKNHVLTLNVTMSNMSPRLRLVNRIGTSRRCKPSIPP